MMKIVAVSGGVDSMVLLDTLVADGASEIVVAHFNHGTRPSADDDQKFVRQACKRYGVKFETQKLHLGSEVSEERARQARYNFLNSLTKRYNADYIYTAHHLDDLAESIAINIYRGTGWRGLTPFQNKQVRHPFLEKGWSRADVLKYAAEHNITFRYDPTNSDEKYLRNRIRQKFSQLSPDERAKLYYEINKLYTNQCGLRQDLDEFMHAIIYPLQQYPRDWFKDLDDDVALEMLRAILQRAKLSATQPQMLDFLQAIRTYAPEKSFNLPGGKLVRLHKTYFVL